MTETQSLGLGSKGPDPKPRLLRESVVIAITVLLGGLAIAAVAVASRDWENPDYVVTDETLWPYLLLVLMAMAAEIVYVPIRHRDSTEDLTFFEVLVVVATLIFAPLVALVLPLVGFVIAAFLLGRPIKKTLFNVGSFALAASALVAVYGSQAAELERFSLPWLLLVFIGVAAFTAVNLLMLAWILSVEGDRSNRSKSIKDFIGDEWKLSFLMGAGSAAIAVVVVVLEVTAPVLTPLALVPAAALWYVYTSAQKRLAERERNEWLLKLNQTLSRLTPLNELISDATENLRGVFLAGEAVVVLSDVVYGSAGGSAEREADHEKVLTDQWLDVASGDVQELPKKLLPDRWARGYVVQMQLDSGARGSLVIGAAISSAALDKILPWGKGEWAIRDADRPILASLVASLSSAIQARKLLDALLDKTEELTAVVDNTGDGIVLMDGRHQVQLWNPAMERITGYSAAHFVDGKTPEIKNQLGRLVDELAETESDRGDEAKSHSLMLTRVDGEARELDVSVVEIAVQKSDQDVDLAYLLTVRDVTRQRRVERMKTDFIASVSHELRTPITPIKGYSQLLLTRWDALPSEKRDKMLQTIFERSEHLLRLVNDLLLASRVSERSTTQLDVDLTEMPLAQLVRDAAVTFPGLTQRLVLTGGDAVVRCDNVRAVQCLSNLISNAEKYSEPASPIRITTAASSDGEWGLVTVSDQGLGIPAAEQDRVFEQFYRVEDPMTMTTGGSGLGLYISRELARAMGGDISVESVLGEGSSFELRLPRQIEEGQHDNASSSR